MELSIEEFEQIPENIPQKATPIPPSINVKKVHFNATNSYNAYNANTYNANANTSNPNYNTNYANKPTSILKHTATTNNPNALSYDDLLSKMGVFQQNGKLHYKEQSVREQPIREQPIKQQQPLKQQQQEQAIPQNSYIYNKLFKQELQQQPNQTQTPLTIEEYKIMLMNKIIQKHQIAQTKSRKLLMPTSNIHVSPSNFPINKLFNFSK